MHLAKILSSQEHIRPRRHPVLPKRFQGGIRVSPPPFREKKLEEPPGKVPAKDVYSIVILHDKPRGVFPEWKNRGSPKKPAFSACRQTRLSGKRRIYAFES